jgi:DMSO/TMAO reductase YedYZ molybdopterin-dependent catalytic subunit
MSMPRPAGGGRLAIAGAAGGAFQLAAGELAASLLPGARSPVTGMGRALIDLTPGPLVDMTVGTVEAMDKPLLMANLVASFLAVGAFAGAAHPSRPRTAAALMLGHGVLAGAAAASRKDSAGRRSLLAAGLGAGAGYGALRTLGRRPSALPAVLGAAVLLGGVARRRIGVRAEEIEGRRLRRTLPTPSRPLPAPSPEASLSAPELSPVFTPNADFYETDVTLPPPALDAGAWTLRVHGLVERPFELSYPELLALGLEELDATLVCVHNPVGGHRIGTARWLGVPLARLLERAGVRPEADQLLARSVDGFSAGVPLTVLDEDRAALVAVGMNGEPLPTEHGYPARLLVPGLWGADANTKWLSELEVTTFAAVEDYWDRRGWPREPSPVAPSSRIDVPRARALVSAGSSVVAGVAWAPPHGVERVEVSIDGSPWQAAELSAELDPHAWRQWRRPWQALPGSHEIRVRTRSRSGALQSEESSPPYPRGAHGLHAVRVEVLAEGARPSGIEKRRAALSTEARRRLGLAAAGLSSWLRHGYPRRPGFSRERHALHLVDPGPDRAGSSALDGTVAARG